MSMAGIILRLIKKLAVLMVSDTCACVHPLQHRLITLLHSVVSVGCPGPVAEVINDLIYVYRVVLESGEETLLSLSCTADEWPITQPTRAARKKTTKTCIRRQPV